MHELHELVHFYKQVWWHIVFLIEQIMYTIQLVLSLASGRPLEIITSISKIGNAPLKNTAVLLMTVTFNEANSKPKEIKEFAWYQL